MLNVIGSYFVDAYMVQYESLDRFEKLVGFIKNPVSTSGYDYPEQDDPYGGSSDDAGSDEERDKLPYTSSRVDQEFGSVDEGWFAGILDAPLE